MMYTQTALPDGYKIYCFDYFDTIAVRSVEPEYVKKLWCKELQDHFLTAHTVKELYGRRRSIEQELCRLNEQSGRDLEFRYQEMAQRMYEAAGIGRDIGMEEFVKKAEDIEFGIECRVQEKCMDVVNEIMRLKSLGKQIFLISDFYAPAGFMRRLLAFHGIEGLFDEVYVSSEHLLTKRSGRLYDYILQKHGTDAGQFLMAGDNHDSDCQVPKEKGIHAYFLDRGRQQEYYRNFRKEHEKSSYVRDCMEEIYRACNRAAYEDITFSLYCFIDKLNAALCRRRIRDVFFLSREGEFLKKLFDAYQRGGIKSHYLMVSRKSTFMASLKPIAEENFEMIFRQYVNISLYDFLSSLGFALELQKEIGTRLSVDIYEKQENLPCSRIYQQLLLDSCFLQEYERLRLEQRSSFAQYLDSFQVDFHKDGMCLVDVGWKGTIQDNLFLFFEEKVEILGLYVGLVSPGKVHPYNQKEGLLFSNIPVPSKYFYVYDENRSIFEVLLGASHGSADRYVRTEHGADVKTVEQPEERELFQKVISPMQEGIYHCFGQIHAKLLNHCFEKSELEDMAARIHAKLVFLPLREQMDLFYQIYHYENFGVFEFTKFKQHSHVPLAERCENILRILVHGRDFFQSGYWGVTALKNAGLGLFIRPYGWYMYHKHFGRGIR